ncbi:MAG: hypothetical protein K9M07_01240 [Simkaniaceae bacterium]|nr:hypothetical protein [Simkaniaceae bacterium]
MTISPLDESSGSLFAIDSMKTKPFYGSFECSAMVKVAIVGIAAIALISALVFIPGAPLAGMAVIALAGAYAGAAVVSGVAIGGLGVLFCHRNSGASKILRESHKLIKEGVTLDDDHLKGLSWALSRYDQVSQNAFVSSQFIPYLERNGMRVDSYPILNQLYRDNRGGRLRGSEGVEMTRVSRPLDDCMVARPVADFGGEEGIGELPLIHIEKLGVYIKPARESHRREEGLIEANAMRLDFLKSEIESRTVIFSVVVA